MVHPEKVTQGYGFHETVKRFIATHAAIIKVLTNIKV